jgi:hypothetical protein
MARFPTAKGLGRAARRQSWCGRGKALIEALARDKKFAEKMTGMDAVEKVGGEP